MTSSCAGEVTAAMISTSLPQERREGLARRLLDRRGLDPPNSLSERGGERSVGAFRDLVPQEHMAGKGRQEVDGGEELVIGAEAGVNLCPLVVDHPIGAIRQPPQRDGRAVHVPSRVHATWYLSDRTSGILQENPIRSKKVKPAEGVQSITAMAEARGSGGGTANPDRQRARNERLDADVGRRARDSSERRLCRRSASGRHSAQRRERGFGETPGNHSPPPGCSIKATLQVHVSDFA